MPSKSYHRDADRHGVTVGTVMGWYAERLGYAQDGEFWSIAGLLHDVDYEQWSDEHCVKARELLREAGCTPELIHAVVAHNYGEPGMVEKPEHEMEKVLFACDELTGLSGQPHSSDRRRVRRAWNSRASGSVIRIKTLPPDAPEK